MSEAKAYFKAIGDVHGERGVYQRIIKTCEYSVQIGDMDFDYSYLIDRKIPVEKHRFFGGNHDNYDVIKDSPHNLGEFGIHTVPNFGDIFFVRGGWSIDRKARVKHDVYFNKVLHRRKDLWDEEELTMQQCGEALELYEQVKPKLLVTHECPLNIVKFVTNPEITYNFGFEQGVIKTRTNQLLQAMTDFNRPKMHVFGHYHTTFDAFIDGTTGTFGWNTGDVPTVAPEHENKYTRYVCVGICKSLILPENFVATL